MIKTLGFFPRFVAEETQFDDNYAVISITDPDQEDAKIQGTSHILRLRFLDITDEDVDINHKHLLFSEQHAQQALAFVHNFDNQKVEKLFIHCEAGVSRSAAVALSLYTALNCNFNQLEQADFANTFVVDTFQKFIEQPIVIPPHPKPGEFGDLFLVTSPKRIL